MVAAEEHTIYLYAPLAIYGLLLFLIAVFVVIKKEAVTTQQFVKGTADYKWKILTVTLLATFIGPAFSLGVVDSTATLAWTFGLAVACTPLHMLATGAFLLKSKSAKSIIKYRTAGALIEDAFGSTSRPIFGFALVVLYTLFAAQLLAGSVVVLEAVYGVSGELIVMLVALVVAAYSITGGIPGVVKTDTLQFVLLILLFAFFVWLGLTVSDAVTIPTEAAVTSQEHDVAKSGVPSIDWKLFFALALVFAMGDAFQPLYMQRAYFAKTANDAGRAFVLAGIIAIVWFLTLTWVGINVAQLPGIDTQNQGVAVSALSMILNPSDVKFSLLLGVIGAGFIGLVMSTLDSVLNTASSTFVDDVLYRNSTSANDETRVSLMKAAIFAIVVIGAMIASIQGDIIKLMLTAYEFWIASALSLVVVGFFTIGRQIITPSAVLFVALFMGIGVWLSPFLIDHKFVDEPIVPMAAIAFIVNILIILCGRAFFGHRRAPNSLEDDVALQTDNGVFEVE